MKILAGILLAACAVCCAFFFLGNRVELSGAVALLGQAHPIFILLAGLCSLCFVAGEAANIHIALNLFGKKTGAAESVSYALTGFFFSGITPSSSGGQPVQLYRMKANHIPVSDGAMALLLELASSQTAILLLGTAGLLVHMKDIAGTFPVIRWFAVGSITINLMLAGIVIALLTKREWICRLELFLKRRIDHRSFASREKRFQWKLSVKRQLRELRRCSQLIQSHKKVMLRMLLVSMLQMLCFFSIPYLAGSSLGIGGLHCFSLLLMQAVLYLSVSLVPVPGASGISETAFVFLLGGMFPKGMAAPAMLLSRGMSFYFLMIVSGLVLAAGGLLRKRSYRLCA